MLPLKKQVPVAIDLRTTGPSPENHEICQLAAVVLNSEYKRASNYELFAVDIIPEFPTSSDRAHMLRTFKPIDQVMLYSSCSMIDALRLWRAWLTKLDGLEIFPIAYQWPMLRPFLMEFSGEHVFKGPPRDLITYAAFVYDRHWFQNYNPGFSSFTRQRLYSCCKVPCLDLKDSLHSCIANAASIRYLLQHPLP